MSQKAKAQDAPSESPKFDSSDKQTLDRLKKAIKDAADLADTLPEPYREKGFELLVPYFITGGKVATIEHPKAKGGAGDSDSRNPTIKLEVKALLQQYSIPESIVTDNFFVDGEIVPVYRVKTANEKLSRIQIKLSLLTAMENALKEGKFQFTTEEVRIKCQNEGKYDPANFKANFKNARKYFVDYEAEPIELNSDGKSELADVLLEFKK